MNCTLERPYVRDQVSKIQDQLGHSSLATIGLYLKALTAGADRYGDAIAARFGLDI
jgi:hypothetical protein